MIMHKDMIEMHKSMLEAQNERHGHLTMRDLMKVWKMRTTSAVSYRLKMLEGAGFVVAVPTSSGTRHVYRAVEQKP